MQSEKMEITLCTKTDFDQIITDIADFWDDERTKGLHNPVYLYEFGNTAYVVKEGEKVIGYLVGLFSQTAPVAYVKFIGHFRWKKNEFYVISCIPYGTHQQCYKHNH